MSCNRRGICGCGDDRCAWPAFCLAWFRIGREMVRRTYEEWAADVE